jgi:hypothetical protein
MDWAPVTGLVGVLAGSALTHWATLRQQRAARDERFDEQRLELYSQWITGMHRIVYGGKLEQPIDALRYKLLLLEKDAALRALVVEVFDSCPSEMTPEGREHYDTLLQDPDPMWKPFDEAVEKLMKAVRASVHS